MDYQIHEAAKMLGITPQTLRFYEQYGISLHERRGENGYRQYSEDRIDLLMCLRKYRNCGFTVAQSARLLKEEDQLSLAEALKTRAGELEYQAKLSCRQAAYLRTVAAHQENLDAELDHAIITDHPDFYFQMVSARRGARLDSKSIETVGKWTGYMPLARWFIRFPDDGETQSGFVINAEDAALMHLDTTSLELIPARRCLRMLSSWISDTENGISGVHRAQEQLKVLHKKQSGFPSVSTLWNIDADKGTICFGYVWIPVEDE